jgi:hypothetical protein
MVKNIMPTDHMLQADVWNPAPLPKFPTAVLIERIKGQIKAGAVGE